MRAITLLLALLTACTAPVAAPGPAPWLVNPALAAENTFKVVAYEGQDPYMGAELWSGTAWKVYPFVVLTAGHVCDPDGQELHFRIQNAKGQSWAAEVIRFEHRTDYSVPGSDDLCLMYVPLQGPGAGITLSDTPLAYGDEVFFVGAPRGEYQDGRQPLSWGHYAGADMVILHSAGGASGSAIIGPSGVVGVLVAGYTDSSGMTLMVPTSAIVSFLGD